MVALRIYFDGERAGPLFRRATARSGEKVRDGARKAAHDAADNIETRGQRDIRSAPGNWGERWPAGLHARVTEGGGNIRISVTHDIWYFNVHEKGAVIHGKPLLWIPLSFNGDELKGVSAKDFPGTLFRVNRVGKAPLLMESSGTGVAIPRYFGKEQVTLPKKFHIEEISREVARDLPRLFRRAAR